MSNSKSLNSITFWLLLFIIFTSCSKNNKINLYPFYDKVSWGYIDEKGVIVIQAKYADAGFFHDGLAPVKDLSIDLYGFINSQGKFVIPNSYAYALGFSEGLAAVVDTMGNFYYIDTKGKITFRTDFASDLGSFVNDRALFMMSEKWGFIDKNGEIVIDPKYDAATDFKNGYAIVKDGFKSGVIDVTGKFIIKPDYMSLYPFEDEVFTFNNRNEIGYFYKGNSTQIYKNAQEIKPFYNGLAAIKTNNWGFINKKGEIEINFLYQDVKYPWQDDIIVVKLNNKWGYLKSNGEYLINPQFENCFLFKNGIAVVKSGSKFGIINKKCKYICNPVYDSIKISELELPNQDIKSITNTIQSGYFDPNLFLSRFFKDHSIGTINSLTRVADIMKTYNVKNYELTGNLLSIHNDNIFKNHFNTDDIIVTELNIYFQKNILKYHIDRDEYGGGLVRRDPNPSSKVIAVSAKFVLTEEGAKHRKKFIDELKNNVIKNLKLDELKFNNYAEVLSKGNAIQLFASIDTSQIKFFIDPRTGTRYKINKKGDTWWMIDNLNYPIEGARYYSDKKKNGKKYGSLYSWEMSKNVCPDNWSLPEREDWENLKEFENTYYYDRETYLQPQNQHNSMWQVYGGLFLGVYESIDVYGNYWSTSEDKQYRESWATSVQVRGDELEMKIRSSPKDRYFMSVRCIHKD